MQFRKLSVEGLEERRLMSMTPNTLALDGTVDAGGTVLTDPTATPLIAGATGTQGLTAPIGPQTGVTAPAGAIIITPSMTDAQIDNLVASNATGATFFFKAGTYRDVDINAKANQTFIGEFGTVFTSATKTTAFYGTSGVTLRNVVIDGYVPTYQHAAIDTADHWTIDHCEVRNTAAVGIQVDSFSTISNSYVHDNAQLGIKAVDSSGGANCQHVTVSNTRVSHNDPLNQFDYGVEGGGSKFWNVNYLTITHCEFDNNVGDGIWCDGDLGGGNRNAEISFNWTHDNNRYGIYQEIGGSAWIHDNLTENNGIAGPYHEADGAGIQVNNSEGLIIENNTIRNNYNALSMASYPRTDTTHLLQNITVRNNDVTATQGVWGVYSDGNLAFHNPYTSNITFDQNAYHFSGNANFDWGGSWISWTQWRALGFDSNGSFGVPNSSSSVVGRKVFYNQSHYDSNNAAINSLDDKAIATDKVAFIPGTGAATFANVSSYTKGINGIMVDLSGSHGTITAADFIFRVGNNNTPSAWAAAPAPTGFSVRAGAGTGGSDRVEITWANGAIKKQWLEAIVKANANTRLQALSGYAAGTGDVFFFGSALADSGLSDLATSATVDGNDELAARSHQASVLSNLPITNPYDYNRDGAVDGNDGLASRDNATSLATVTKYTNVSIASAAPTGDSAPVVSALVMAATPSSESSLPTAQQRGAWPLTAEPSVADQPGLAAAGLFQAEPERDTVQPETVPTLDDFARVLAWDDTILDGVLADLELS
jgi:Right handed beta helix region